MASPIIGTSKNNNIREAVSEATSSIKNPKFIMIVSSYDKLEAQSKLIQEKYPNAKCIGTSGTSFENGNVHDNTLIVTAFPESVEVVTGVIRNISTMPLYDIKSVEENIRKISPGRDNTVCIEFCTGSEEKLISTMQSAISGKNIPLVGGTVFGYPDGTVAKVTVDGTAYEDACAYAFIKNKSGKIKIYKENIYAKINDKAHIATKVNRATRELIELDGKPAADVYSRELNIPKDKIIDSVLNNPIGRVVGDEIYITSMYKLGSNGSLFNYKQSNENDTFYFLELLDYEEIMRNTFDKIHNDMNHVSFVFSVDCIYRYLLFNKKNYINSYVKKMSTLGPHVGIVGGGEQYNNQHVNQTMVCAVFE